MSKFSNWPTSRPAVQPSSRPENDESLLPSRIAREKITPRIPRDLALELRRFCFMEALDQQDVVAEGVRLFMDRWHEERGRPAVQPSSRPPIKESEISDLNTDTERDDARKSSSEIGGRPAVQDSGLETSLRSKLSALMSDEAFDTWITPLKISFDEDGGKLVFKAPNPIVESWVKTNYGHLIAQVLGEWSLHWESAEPVETIPRAVEDFKPAIAADQKEELLNFYAVVLENPITEGDILNFEKVRDCSPSSVRAGIMRCRMKARSRPGSFNYCVKAIRQIERAGVGPQLVESLREEVFKQPLLDTLPFNRERKSE